MGVGTFRVIWKEIWNDKLATLGLFLFIGIVATVYIWGFLIDETYAMRLSMFTMNQAPSADFPLGTDPLGRCMLRQLVLASRNSLNIAFLVTFGGASIGIFIGLIMGFYGGYVEMTMQRIIGLWGMIPGLMLIILLRSIITFETWVGFSGVMILVTAWLTMTGLVRVMTFQQSQLDYVSASKTLGTPNIVIIFKKIVPNIASIMLLNMILGLASSIGFETALTALGYGLPFATPSLGRLIALAMNPIVLERRVWQWIPAVIYIVAISLCILGIGEAVKRAINPRQRR